MGILKARLFSSFRSGIQYNRGACTLHHCGEPITDHDALRMGLDDSQLEVLHFMGADLSKFMH